MENVFDLMVRILLPLVIRFDAELERMETNSNVRRSMIFVLVWVEKMCLCGTWEDAWNVTGKARMVKVRETERGKCGESEGSFHRHILSAILYLERCSVSRGLSPVALVDSHHSSNSLTKLKGPFLFFSRLMKAVFMLNLLRLLYASITVLSVATATFVALLSGLSFSLLFLNYCFDSYKYAAFL